MLNILKFLDLFAMSMCPNLKELNLMQKQENVFSSDMTKGRNVESVWIQKLIFLLFLEMLVFFIKFYYITKEWWLTKKGLKIQPLKL